MFNTIDRFGIVSILLHWVIALSILGLFALGWYMVDLTYYDRLYNSLPNVHKSLGILLIFVFVASLIWRLINLKPAPLANSSQFEVYAAKAVHWLLTILIAFILISGYLIPTANGSAIGVFNWFEVPALVSHIDRQEDLAGIVHRYLSYAIIGLAAIHASAALKHHLVDKDDTLNRMLGRLSNKMAK